jgi:hypothetical protein
MWTFIDTPFTRPVIRHSPQGFIGEDKIGMLPCNVMEEGS